MAAAASARKPSRTAEPGQQAAHGDGGFYPLGLRQVRALASRIVRSSLSALKAIPRAGSTPSLPIS